MTFVVSSFNLSFLVLVTAASSFITTLNAQPLHSKAPLPYAQVRASILYGNSSPNAEITMGGKRRGTSIGWMIFGGIAGGAIGATAGAFTGAFLNDGDVIIPVAAYAGAFIGATLGTPLGIHLANGRHGNYLLSVGATSLVMLSGLAIIFYTPFTRSRHGAYALGGAMSAGMIAAGIYIENKTADL